MEFLTSRSRAASQVWILAAVFSLACYPAPAQNTTANTGVTGTVTDTSGGVIPSAQIGVKSASGELRQVGSDDKGEWTVLGLAPGKYDVFVSAPGFKDFTASGATVSAGTLTKIESVLSPANASGTSVEVSGVSAGSVEVDTSQLSGTITKTEVTGIPLNGRNFSQLIGLAPGVSNQTGQDEAKVGVVGSVKYSVNGGRVEYNTFDVDGSDVLNTGINGSSSTLVVFPSVDAIEEIKVLTSNYGAMYGRTASGVVLVTTKGGTQDFHGNGYYFGRNEIFNARNFFDETQGAPLYRRHDLGGTIGGPVYIPGGYNKDKTKTFFFFSEEYRLEKSPFQFNQAVPSVAERTGDFSDVCPALGSQSGFSRSQFPDCPADPNLPFDQSNRYRPYPGNNLLGDSPILDQNSVAILNTGVVPLPNSAVGCNSTINSCYVQSVSPETDWREELFRVDHNFSQNTRAAFRFIHDSWNTTTVTPQWSYLQSSFPTVENDFIGPGITLLARLTQTLSPTLVNDFVFSYVNSDISLADKPGPGVASLSRPASLDSPCYLIPNPQSDTPTQQCPVGSLFGKNFGGKLPSFVIGPSNLAYGGNGFAVDTGYMPWSHTNPTYTLSDNLSKVWGKHNLQAGGQIEWFHRRQTNGPVGAATGEVQGILTYSSVHSSTGNSFADFLLSRFGNGTLPYSYTQDSTQRQYVQEFNLGEPYVQDDWKANKRLTVNLGLRVSLFGTYREVTGQAWNWVPSAYDRSLAGQAYVSPFFGTLYDSATKRPVPFDPNNLDPRITNGLVHCGYNGVPSSCMGGHLWNPAPRVGFAWDVLGDGKTSLRGGYGVFFEHGTGVEANTGSLEGNAPLVLTNTLIGPAISSWECIGVTTLPCSNVGLASPLSITSIPTKAIWPYAQQWSLSIQRELGSHLVASAAYVGSKGTHLTDERELNQIRPVSDSQNPFPKNTPLITNQVVGGIPLGDCGGFGKASQAVNGSYVGGFLLVNGASVFPGDPGYSNLIAACQGFGVSTLNSIRQFAPTYGLIYGLENSADSSYNAFQATLRRVEGPLTLGVSYTFSHNNDNSSDRTDANFINAYDLRSNWAKSNYDQRHLLNVSYVYQLPLLKALQSPGDMARKILGDWELSGITIYQSGTPFSVINNGSNAGNLSVPDNAGLGNGVASTSYPDLVSNPYYAPPVAGDNGKSFGPLLLNPGAFAAPRGLTFGSAGRNALDNPHRTNFDIALLKRFKMSEKTNGEFRLETFNTFNHTQFRIFDANAGNTGSNTISCYGGPASGYSAGGGDGVDCLTGNAFLHPVNAHRPRTIQLGLKFAF